MKADTGGIRVTEGQFAQNGESASPYKCADTPQLNPGHTPGRKSLVIAKLFSSKKSYRRLKPQK